MQVLDVALVTTHKTFENVSPRAQPVLDRTYGTTGFQVIAKCARV